MTPVTGFRLARLAPSFTAWQAVQQTWDVCVVEAGAAEWRYRGECRRSDAGMVRLKEPGERFVTEQVLAPTGYLILQVEPERFNGLTDVSAASRHLTRAQLSGPSAALAASVLQRAKDAHTLLARDECIAYLIRVALLENLEQSACNEPPRVTRGLWRARDFLHAHVHDEVPLATLAALAGMHEVSLVRAFRRAFGCPPHQLQIALRVRSARRLLDSGLSGAAVAAQVGFHDQSHLIRHFKRIVGISPGSYAATRCR